MRIFFAATTSGWTPEDRAAGFQEGKPKYILETFFAGEQHCEKVLNEVGRENFLLDSGAFSYMSGAKCTKEQLEKYLDRYIDFINRNDVKYFFELDVDTIFGIEFVEMLRSRLERGTGKPCIPVGHKCRGVEYWKKMCREYKYIAIGGLVFHVKKQEYASIRKMVDYAHKHGVKVHGLGFTKTRELATWNFYSVDSSSWKTAAIRGQQLHFFNGKHIQTRPLDKGDKKTNLSRVIKHNFTEWCKYQKYMDMKRW